MMDRRIFKATVKGEAVFDKTKQELAEFFEISMPTLKKYLDVWAKQKGMPYRFFDVKLDKLSKFDEQLNKKPLKAGNPEASEKKTIAPPPLKKSAAAPTVLDTMSKFKVLYLDYKNSNNVSKHTIDNIHFVLDRFYDYISNEANEEKEISVNDMSKYFLSNYLNRLTEEGMAKSTQKLHVIIIKNFFNFIADYDVKLDFLHDKFGGIKIKTAQKEKVGLLQSEQQKLLICLKNLDKQASYLPQRNALIIKILLYTGLRISELINIKWTDIAKTEDKTHGDIYSIIVTGKGDKERFAYILASEIKNNLDYLEKIKGKSEYVFISTHGKKCDRTRLYVVIKKIMNDAGIPRAGLHIFRHTFARNMVDKDVNLATIKDLLGHANIAITAQFYAKSNENAKRNALFNK